MSSLHIGHVAASAPGTGLIDSDPAHGTPVALCVSLLNVMPQDPSQPSIVLID